MHKHRFILFLDETQKMTRIALAKTNILLFALLFGSINGKLLCEKPFQYGRFDLFNSESETFADVIKKDKSWIKTTEIVAEYSQFIANKLVDEFNDTACENTSTYFNSAQNRVIMFNLGRKEDLENCIYDITWSPSEDRYESRLASRLYDSLNTFDTKLVSDSIYQAIQNYLI